MRLADWRFNLEFCIVRAARDSLLWARCIPVADIWITAS